MSVFAKLQSWYFENCDGDWEHYGVIKISTTDNPGWLLEVDTSQTDAPMADMNYRFVENSEDDWIGYKIVDGKFIGGCGPLLLADLIAQFLEHAELCSEGSE